MSLKPKKVKRPTPIDPIFRVPEGAEDEFFVTKESADRNVLESSGYEPVRTPFGVLYQDATTPANSSQYLQAPRNLVVFDQKIRRAPGGVVVVDIVTQFDDVAGASNYELRVVKV